MFTLVQIMRIVLVSFPILLKGFQLRIPMVIASKYFNLIMGAEFVDSGLTSELTAHGVQHNLIDPLPFTFRKLIFLVTVMTIPQLLTGIKVLLVPSIVPTCLYRLILRQLHYLMTTITCHLDHILPP